MMHTLKRTPTTEMEVTSIRLERELKERLKEISGHQGYQALIREVLWKYVQQKSGDYRHRFTSEDIRATVAATANAEERCGITGKIINPNEPMLLGLTSTCDLIPLSLDSLTAVTPEPAA
jgi:predicted DNA-binding protein